MTAKSHFNAILAVITLLYTHYSFALLNCEEANMNPTNWVIQNTYNLSFGSELVEHDMHQAVYSSANEMLYTYGRIEVLGVNFTLIEFHDVSISQNVSDTPNLFNDSAALYLHTVPSPNAFGVDPQDKYMYFINKGGNSMMMVQLNVKDKKVSQILKMTPFMSSETTRIYCDDDELVYFTAIYRDEQAASLCWYDMTNKTTPNCARIGGYEVPSSFIKTGDTDFVITTRPKWNPDHALIVRIDFASVNFWETTITFDNRMTMFKTLENGVADFHYNEVQGENLMFRLDKINGQFYFYTMKLDTGERLMESSILRLTEGVNSEQALKLQSQYTSDMYLTIYGDNVYMTVGQDGVQLSLYIYQHTTRKFVAFFYVNDLGPSMLGSINNHMIVSESLPNSFKRISLIPMNSANADSSFEIVPTNPVEIFIENMSFVSRPRDQNFRSYTNEKMTVVEPFSLTVAYNEATRSNISYNLEF